ncbi:hypothetical protein EAH57_00535 [Acinetobacter sp. 2JN-4]|uniref:DUF2536 family protein n=1 Tax=Acinetobacter halotolerans TaxID=1752076 RepID=A0A4Q6XL72_9GAMM|nr:hypothetical protein [Acinetobacter halotolerans]RLZ10900.1 hypothetical protein EAH57_00535 [Acinetobacter sp. 2JN-4]RZF55868.1 hypothetical protein EXE30_03415 [Acinetobacter halotolerans]
MSKIKSFEEKSIQDLENSINKWLREEFSNHNLKVNIKNISHCHTYNNSEILVTALIAYEYK